MRGSCGVWLFRLPANHPFEPACKLHDEAYECVDWDVGTKQIDQDFYHRCLFIAGDNEALKAQALRYYHIVRAWGEVRKLLAKVGIVWSCECNG